MIGWVNSLELLEEPITDIRELDDARFFVKLMNLIFPGTPVVRLVNSLKFSECELWAISYGPNLLMKA